MYQEKDERVTIVGYRARKRISEKLLYMTDKARCKFVYLKEPVVAPRSRLFIFRKMIGYIYEQTTNGDIDLIFRDE